MTATAVLVVLLMTLAMTEQTTSMTSYNRSHGVVM
jgi:hypothetical protein